MIDNYDLICNMCCLLGKNKIYTCCYMEEKRLLRHSNQTSQLCVVSEITYQKHVTIQY